MQEIESELKKVGFPPLPRLSIIGVEELEYLVSAVENGASLFELLQGWHLSSQFRNWPLKTYLLEEASGTFKESSWLREAYEDQKNVVNSILFPKG